MIRTHEFNTRWFGAAVGVVDDPAFFERARAERARALGRYAWAEYRGPLDAGSHARVAGSGFLLLDVQLRFRIALGRVPTSPSLERLAVRSAAEAPFRVAAVELADFEHERFRALPGTSAADVNRRYALWSDALVAQHPDTCLAILSEGEVQGWFLARPRPSGPGGGGGGGSLELTLAMLRRGAALSGAALYQRALLALAERGARVGYAGFSATNTAVHNIYAALGARFVAPEGCWIWHPGLAPPDGRA